jgi:hypothetical protein
VSGTLATAAIDAAKTDKTKRRSREIFNMMLPLN